jgi:signal transduction histidine kinase
MAPDLEVVYRKSELEQVIRILADNALKFTTEGKVSIRARKWQHGRQSGFQVAVEDSGPGIAEELQQRIFEPFVQGFRHETRSHGGVGLGLSIASKVVKRMGGEIILESVPAQGSRFTVLVPEGTPTAAPGSFYEPWPPLEAAKAKSEAPKESRTSDPTETAPLPVRKAAEEDQSHVLIVDDEEINREVVWQALRHLYRVTRAEDGPRCLGVLRTQKVDLVLLDIMMPGMSGYEVLETMRAEGLLQHVPVMVLSAKTSREAVVKGLELGATDYLGKPFHRDELLCRIRNLLELKKKQDQLKEEVTVKANALHLAEEASKIKSQFLANISHELRTPLNGIVGFAQLALGSCPDGADELKTQLSTLLQCGENLCKVVDSILDLATLESRDDSIDYVAVRPSQVVEKITAQFSGEATRKNLALEVSVEPRLEAEFWTSPEKLERALGNLLENAVRFTSTGSVTVEARLLEPQDEEHEPLIECQVRDTGPGVAPEKRTQIFLPFCQGDNSHTRKHGGVGLGLTVSRSFARLLGGDVTVRSSGQGSTFTLRVLAHTSRPAAASAELTAATI